MAQKSKMLSALSIEPDNKAPMQLSPSRYSDTHKQVPNSTTISQFDLNIDIEPKKVDQPLPVAPQSDEPNVIIAIEESVDITNGTMIGSNKVDRIIGQGGMTKVYRVWNEELETWRCLKIIREDTSSSNYERFTTEAKICAQFDNPNIVHIYNVGNFHTLPYIEMEYIQGETLQYYISKYGRIPSKVAASVAFSVAKALVHIHTHHFTLYGKEYDGIIHRDLKPSNIMVSNDGSVKLMDFGIARPVETGFHTSVDNNIVGTMQYFSPEQLSNADVDQTTDIYAFGAILYEMLTGEKTFPYTTITTLVQKKTLNSFKPLNKYEFNMDGMLRKISSQCLKTDRRKRYANADLLHLAITEVIQTYKISNSQKEIREFIASPEAYIELNNNATKSEEKKKRSPFGFLFK